MICSSVSSVILNGGHDGAHAGKQGTVVDGAGGGQVQAPQVVFLRRFAVPLYFRDDLLFVVVHEGEGGDLAVDAGIGHQPADFLHPDGGAEVAACQMEVGQLGHQVPHGGVRVLVAVVVGLRCGVFKDPLQNGVAEGVVHVRGHEIAVIVQEAEAAVGVFQMGFLPEQVYVSQDHIADGVRKVTEQALVIIVQEKKILHTENGGGQGHRATEGIEPLGTLAVQLVHRPAPFVPIGGENEGAEGFHVRGQGGDSVQFFA